MSSELGGGTLSLLGKDKQSYLVPAVQVPSQFKYSILLSFVK